MIMFLVVAPDVPEGEAARRWDLDEKIREAAGSGVRTLPLSLSDLQPFAQAALLRVTAPERPAPADIEPREPACSSCQDGDHESCAYLILAARHECPCHLPVHREAARRALSKWNHPHRARMTLAEKLADLVPGEG